MGVFVRKFSYDSMGTKWEVSIWDNIDEELFQNIEKAIIKMSEEFDQIYSRFKRDSLVWKIAEGSGTYDVPEDFLKMLQLYFDLYELTEKKLNPLIGFTISDLGYDDRYTLKPEANIRQTPDLLETVHADGAHLHVSEQVLFDFGALGKGYFVDKISDFLLEKGIKNFLINGSGDIFYSGVEPIQVGLEHPDNEKLAIGTISMQTGAMCASGINRRRWDKYHHVIDPQKSTSVVETIKATWVIAENAALADALASCLFFVIPEKIKAARYDFEYVVMNSKNQIKKSDGWKGEFFV